MSSESNVARNLLFGILALQMDFVSRDALIAAMNAWVQQKSRPLGDILEQQQALTPEEHGLLDALVRMHLQKHGQDPRRGLAAIRPLRSVRQEFQRLADPEIQASLAHLPAEDAPHPTETQPAATLTQVPGSLRYQVLRPHARGGLGEVFVARDAELNREVALKEIQWHSADSPDSRARFVFEAEITGRLEHPGIVPVYGLGNYADGRPYYAMRFIQGDSLKDAIERFYSPDALRRPASERNLELRQLLDRFVDVCNAIEYAHDRGVLHRDIKPGNVMLGKYGETLVVDWGLAKAMGRPPEKGSFEATLQPTAGSGTATQMGRAIGTPGYMGPEQAAGRLDDLGPRSDVYSLGATLYTLLTGKVPVEGRDIGEVLRRVQSGQFPRPRQVAPHVPTALEAVCLKAMALQPDDRYQSARALAEDVEHWLADEPVSAHRDSAVERLSRWARRHRAMVRAAAAALVAITAIAVVFLILIDGERARAESQRARAEQLAHEKGELAGREQRLRERAQRLATTNAQLAEDERRQRRRAELQTVNVMFEQASSLTNEGKTVQGLLQLTRALHLLESGAERASRNADVQDPGDASQLVASAVSASEPPHPEAAEGTKLASSIRRYLAGWARELHRLRAEISEHEDGVSAAAFSPDGRLVLIGTPGGTARLWSAATGEPAGQPFRHSGEVLAVAFSRDGARAFVATSSELRVWEIETGEPVGEPLQLEQVFAAALSAEGTRLLTGTYEGTARLWDVETGRPLGSPIPHSGPIRHAAFAPDGSLFLTDAPDGLRFWSAATGEPVGKTLPMREEVLDVAFSPDGKHVLCATDDGTARLWNVRTGEPAGKVLQVRGRVLETALSPDGRYALIGFDDGTARLWDVSSGRPVGGAVRNASGVDVVAFSPEGGLMLTGGFDGSVRLWEVSTAGPVGPPMSHPIVPRQVAFAPDGKTILTGGIDGTVRHWDAATLKPLGSPLPDPLGLSAVAFSPDAKLALTGEFDGRLCLWNLANGASLWKASSSGTFVTSIAFSPDAGLAAAGGSEGTTRVWDTTTGRPLTTEPPKHKSDVTAAAFSPDGKIAITGSRDETACLWETATGALLAGPLKHSAPVIAVAFSPDGRMVATASGNEARLWQSATGQPAGTPLLDESPITAVAFSPDGGLLLTGNQSGTVRLWDWSTGKPLGSPLPHDKTITAVAFSPDGKLMATASEDHQVRLWNVPEPLRAPSAQIALWLEASTGCEIDESGRLRCLGPAEFRDRTAQSAVPGNSSMGIEPRRIGRK